MFIIFSRYRSILLIIIIIFIIDLFSNNTFSIDPEEFLDNSLQESRARNISQTIRCLVCQNQSIDESSALLAKDMRILIRKKITEGLTDKQIYTFLTERYGSFILLKPPLNISTILLWFLPFILLIIGLFIIYWNNKKSKKI